MKTINKYSMETLILGHLLTKKSISSVEAQALYRCRSLSRRITTLKREGWTIKSELKQDATGQRYARYTIIDTAVTL
jgi:hypothetical protein